MFQIKTTQRQYFCRCSTHPSQNLQLTQGSIEVSSKGVGGGHPLFACQCSFFWVSSLLWVTMESPVSFSKYVSQPAQHHRAIFLSDVDILRHDTSRVIKGVKQVLAKWRWHGRRARRLGSASVLPPPPKKIGLLSERKTQYVYFVAQRTEMVGACVRTIKQGVEIFFPVRKISILACFFPAQSNKFCLSLVQKTWSASNLENRIATVFHPKRRIGMFILANAKSRCGFCVNEQFFSNFFTWVEKLICMV